MELKKFVKYILLGIGILIIIALIYSSFPRVGNPSPDYQTELDYGNPIAKEIENILTPKEEPQRTRAVIILENGKIVYEYGPTEKIMNIASIRKAILSLLYGIAVNKGLINLDKTLAELKIDEIVPLTADEKKATIRDLLMFKSGIYLPAQGEHDSQITDRPKRGSHKHGTYFFSNNFDANALGTIFMQETGTSIGDFMEENLAKPLGMQDFTKDNVIIGDPWFFPKKRSLHEQYYIYMSTRDLARVGAMVANNGKWNDTQIVSEEWIKESTTEYSHIKDSHNRYDGVAYQWYLDSNNKTIWTDGYGERFMIIDPNKKLTLVEQNFTGNSFLTTGLWLLSRNMDSGLANLIKAHQMLAQK